MASYLVTEDAGKVVLGFTLSEPSTMDGERLLRTADGTAKSPDDYTGTTSGLVVIPARQLTGTITVPIIADPVFESNETFGVVLTGVAIDGASQAATGALTSAGVTIVEDDPLVSFGAGSYSVAENAGKASIGLVLSHASSHDVYVLPGRGRWQGDDGSGLQFRAHRSRWSSRPVRRRRRSISPSWTTMSTRTTSTSMSRSAACTMPAPARSRPRR